jgi:hypothetical protein
VWLFVSYKSKTLLPAHLRDQKVMCSAYVCMRTTWAAHGIRMWLLFHEHGLYWAYKIVWAAWHNSASSPEHFRGLAFVVNGRQISWPPGNVCLSATSCYPNIYVHILGFLHVMQWNSILLGPWSDCMRSEESQLSSVLDGAITTYVRPKNISANWQLESVFLFKNVSFLEALSQGIIVAEGTDWLRISLIH